MKTLIRWCACHPVFANLLMLCLLVGGFVAARNLRREMMPSFSLDRVLIYVPYPYAQPDEVEEGICIKIEEALEGLTGIKKIESVAMENGGSLIVEVKSDADARAVLDDIKIKVDSIDTFPEDAEKPLITELFRRDQVINLVLYGQAPERSRKELARQIREDLLKLPGISQVVWSGVREYEISIEVSEEALQEYGLTFAQVVTAVRNSSLNMPGGTLRTQQEQIRLQTRSRRYTGKQYADLVLTSRADGTIIRLRDVAQVVDGFEEDGRFGRFNGHPAILLSVYKTADQDALQIAHAVKQYYARKQHSLPGDMHLAIWSDSSQYIQQRLEMLLHNGKIGFIFVLLSLWFFLSLRLSFWVALGIPVSFGGGFMVLWCLGQSLNMISMFAMIMALGMVVDDAIVVGENIYAHRQRGLSGLQAAVRGVEEMAAPVFAAVATTIAAFGPLFFVSGIMGKFIAEIPSAVTAVLTTSLLESLFILPAHLRHTPGGQQHGWRQYLRQKVDACMRFFIQCVYRPVYVMALRYRLVVVALSLAALLICGGLLKGGVVPFIFFPKLDDEIIKAKVVFPQGTPVSVTDQAVARIEAAARQLNQRFADEPVPVVQQIYGVVGATSGRNATIGAHIGEVILELSKAEIRQRHSRTIIAAWRQQVGEIPQTLSLTFGTLRHGPGGKPIEIRLLGQDYTTLRAAVNEIKRELHHYSAVFDIEDDYEPGKRELLPCLRPEGRLLGLTSAEIGRQLFRGFAGAEVLRLQRGSDEVKVKVRYCAQQRRSLADLENIRIRLGGGREIPFSEVAYWQVRRGPAKINRQNKRRRLRVIADVDEALVPAGRILARLEREVLRPLVTRYPGLTYSLEGQQQEKRDSLASLKNGFVYALLAIFAILALVFHSYLQPLIIMAIIPFGFVGAVLGHWLLGYPLAIMSVFGVVALAGVVVNDSLVFIDRINVGIREGLSVQEAVEQAGPARFRAILLTTITTFAGLAPLIMEQSMQAQFIIPMAISLGFGLLFATFLTLFLVPTLFLYLNTARRLVHWLRTGQWPSMEAVEPAKPNAQIKI